MWQFLYGYIIGIFIISLAGITLISAINYFLLLVIAISIFSFYKFVLARNFTIGMLFAFIIVVTTIFSYYNKIKKFSYFHTDVVIEGYVSSVPQYTDNICQFNIEV